jgi:hypothetical protein
MASTNAARGIISKINFPKEALVLSGIYKLLFNSSFKVLLLVVFIFAFGVGFHWSLLLLPLVLVMAVVFGTSLGLLITPIGLLYSDVSRLISMGLSLFMYVTPVVYGIPKTGIMKTIMTYNPFTPFILTIRDVAVGSSPEFLKYFIILLLVILVFNLSGKIILGDSGSYVLGLFSGIYLINFSNQNLFISPFFIILLLWYPCFELLFSMIRRSGSKTTMYKPDIYHLHQLLFNLFKKKVHVKSNINHFIVSSLINLFFGALRIFGSIPYDNKYHLPAANLEK